MTKKTRLILLLVCAALFVILAPYLVLYSLGYRVDFTNRKIVATGGIYVKAEPAGAAITIDKKLINSDGFFNDYAFTQNLLPGNHQISITKDGYFNYQKTLTVVDKQVTKLEHVMLFKKNISFQAVPPVDGTTTKAQFALLAKNPSDIFTLKDGSLYYASGTTTIAVKNVMAFTVANNSLLWIGADGLLHKSALQNNALAGEPLQLSKIPVPIKKTTTNSLTVINDDAFLFKNNEAYRLNMKTGGFEAFQIPLSGMKLSPDGKKIAYYSRGQIWYSTVTNGIIDKKVLVENLSGNIGNLFWLNNDYVIISFENRVVISETDPRGNTNSVILPQTITLGEKTIVLKNPEIFLHDGEKKLYVLNGEDLIVSEKLVP